MYKIPENFDVSEIINQVIFQIAFGLNFISLFFDKGFIQFRGSFSFKSVFGFISYLEVYPVQDDLGFLRLLQKKITNIRINKRNELRIEFEDTTHRQTIRTFIYQHRNK